jgi:hypothetical protein
MDERGLLAVHEAGHCLATAEVGGIVRTVSLRPPQTEATFCGVGARGELLALSAGNAAVSVANGGLWSESDAVDADRLIRRHGLTEADRVAAYFRADELVRKHWAAIERVARELSARERLSGAEVRALIAETKEQPKMKKDTTFRGWVACWRDGTPAERAQDVENRAIVEFGRRPQTTAEWARAFGMLTDAIKAERPAPDDAKLLLAALVTAAKGRGISWQGGGSPW